MGGRPPRRERGGVSRARGAMLADTAARLAAAVERARRTSGPPTAPAAWERALLRRDALVPDEVRQRLELDRIDRAWSRP